MVASCQAWGCRESHSLTYTAFSRATRLSDIGISIGGLTRERITESIQKGNIMTPRIVEKTRLRGLVALRGLVVALRGLAAATEQELRVPIDPQDPILGSDH
jgi:hypothetical protein